jgi:predicted ATPase
MTSELKSKSILVDNDNIIEQIISSDKKIYSIVLTGGPSAGKSTIIQFVKKYFNKYNSDKKDNEKILVLTLNETATHLINQGVSFTMLEPKLFQELVMSTQISMEKTLYDYAESLKIYYDKVVILMDRGLIDEKAYLIEKELDDIVEENWNGLLKGLKLESKYKEHLSKYDIIIHIVTGAQGSGFFYTTENNAARTETATQALELDKKTLKVWEFSVSIPIYVLDNREGIICRQGKGVQIIKMISKLIGKEYSNIFVDTTKEIQESLLGGYLKYKSKYIKLKNEIKMKLK